MSLQKHYAAVLLLLLFLFGGSIAGIIFLNDRQYLLAILLVAILYLSSFLIGKTLSLLFLQLSLLKFIRKNKAFREKAECGCFLQSQYRRTISDVEFEKLAGIIYSELLAKHEISIDEQRIVLQPQQP